MEVLNSSISSFKKFVIKIIIPLILFILVIGFTFQYFFEKIIILNSDINGSYKVNRIINEYFPDEIPILGSSRAEGTYVPSIINENCFNYGLAGAQDDVLLFFMHKECNKNKNTPIIVNFDIDGLNHSLGNISNYIYNSNDSSVKDLLRNEYKFIFRIPFFKYYGYYEYFLKMYLNTKINMTKKTDKGASLELNTLTNSKFQELVNQRIITFEEFKNTPKLEFNLLNLIKENTHRKFIFIVAPYHKSCFVNFRNIHDVRAFLNKLSLFHNVRTFDFTNADYPDSFYMNTSHLNYLGAKRFSIELKDSLTQNNLLK